MDGMEVKSLRKLKPIVGYNANKRRKKKKTENCVLL